MKMYLPLFLVVLSNVVYHICAKSTSKEINTFASLSITYAVGAIASILIYFVSQKNGSLIAEYSKLNWSSFVLGFAIVGLEAGFILMYKVGWDISVGQTVQSAILAVALIAVGFILYGESFSIKKVLGVGICLAGLYLLNH